MVVASWLSWSALRIFVCSLHQSVSSLFRIYGYWIWSFCFWHVFFSPRFVSTDETIELNTLTLSFLWIQANVTRWHSQKQRKLSKSQFDTNSNNRTDAQDIQTNIAQRHIIFQIISIFFGENPFSKWPISSGSFQQIAHFQFWKCFIWMNLHHFWRKSQHFDASSPFFFCRKFIISIQYH